MEILRKCNEWLEVNPDKSLVKQKLADSELNLLRRTSVVDLLTLWIEQLDQEVESPNVSVSEFSEDSHQSVTRWLSWLTKENPDRDVVASSLASTNKEAEEYQCVVDALIEYLGEDYLNDSNESVSTSTVKHSAKPQSSDSSALKIQEQYTSNEDGSYSLGNEVDKNIPVFKTTCEKKAAFDELKAQLGTSKIITNRKIFNDPVEAEEV
ncbi:hypothetical protein [Vibrio sp. D431a]|uniref:hypothetical protein n=1 Tax=Vibrio sp. D431a TaxID=2837388 RepID=UPI0025548075|nr:hypothetical protein [Vibrio sp. D431a]MDK9790142.1 hypothetical protein [Vibrio sp. D431a]